MRARGVAAVLVAVALAAAGCSGGGDGPGAGEAGRSAGGAGAAAPPGSVRGCPPSGGQDPGPDGTARDAGPAADPPSAAVLAQVSVRLARQSLELRQKDPRLATALAQEAARRGHGPEVVAALDALKGPHLLMNPQVPPGAGAYRHLQAAAGAVLAGASDTGAVTVWDLGTGRPLLCARLPGPATGLALAGGGGLVAAATGAGEIRVWSVRDRREAARFTRPARGNGGMVFTDTASGVRFVFGSGAVLDVRSILDWKSVRQLPTAGAGTVRDLAVLRDAGYVEPVLVGVNNGSGLARWLPGEGKALDGLRLTPFFKEAVPHRFGAVSEGANAVWAGLSGGRSRLVGIESGPGGGKLREIFLSGLGDPQSPPMAGDGAGAEEYGFDVDPGLGSTGDRADMLSVTGLGNWIAATADHSRAVLQSTRDDASGTVETQLVGPAGSRIGALAAWGGRSAPSAAFALDDGSVAVWVFDRRPWQEAHPLKAERDSVTRELLRLCQVGPVLLDREEWQRHLPEVPYRPGCPDALTEEKNKYGTQAPD
ncbi:hypothetical protein [Streptomyces sp. NBC_00239]|uniref:hypothetical protein n=1 Tax=Streptomyces sp. NBC_00239 TaxID=2903640 RepID=UPI002E27F6CD|nr:hypothetical protein [Streptomyces sp. NBC_00239]